MQKTLVIVSLSLISMLAPLGAQTASDLRQVKAFYQLWMASASKGFAAYARFYAEDGYILPPGSPPVVGRAAIAAWFEKANATSAYSTRPSDVSVDETRFLTKDWVIYRSTLRGQRVPRAGGDPVAFETKYVDLIHRTTSGWEVSFRMWSDNR